MGRIKIISLFAIKNQHFGRKTEVVPFFQEHQGRFDLTEPQIGHSQQGIGDDQRESVFNPLGYFLRFVEDGEELMGYLLGSGKYADATRSPRPVPIFLDLNMPRKDGRQAVVSIKANAGLRRILSPFGPLLTKGKTRSNVGK